MNRQFHNKRQSLTLIDKHKVSVNYSIDQNIFIGHMFNIKLEEKSYKMSFKALLVKVQRSKNRGRGDTMCPFSLPLGQIGLSNTLCKTKIVQTWNEKCLICVILGFKVELSWVKFQLLLYLKSAPLN